MDESILITGGVVTLVDSEGSSMGAPVHRTLRVAMHGRVPVSVQVMVGQPDIEIEVERTGVATHLSVQFAIDGQDHGFLLDWPLRESPSLVELGELLDEMEAQTIDDLIQADGEPAAYVQSGDEEATDADHE